MAFLDAEIAEIEKACRDGLKADEALKAQENRLRSIPGIGPVAALTLIAHMPELGDRSAKAAAALAGLAPFNVDSGTLRGKRHIRGGRKRVRDALYMAALTASRMPAAFKPQADRMQQRGKPFKVIIIAIARKILAIANAVTRDKTTFSKA